LKDISIKEEIMRAKSLFLWILLLTSCTAFAEPKVVVLPFDPMIDSIFVYREGKQSVLDYRNALQQMLTTELGKRQEIRVIELSMLEKYIKDEAIHPTRWNDAALASKIGAALGADYAVIGSYGEFSREIRIDSRIAIVAISEVPPGNTVTAIAKLWEDLPSAATKVAEQVIPIVTASGHIRAVSKGILYPEGDVADFDPTGRLSSTMCRLAVWTNGPAPTIETTPATEFTRCDRVDLLNISAEKQRTSTCKAATLPAGKVEIKIIHRGFLPYSDVLTLTPGKAYRLEVKLEEVKVQIR
jgi:hypothetical protein